jgi:uncharacterized membrane protein required for colicin V production
MSPTPPSISGSPLWQLAFISFAIVLILFEVLRGWRRGLARQLARLGALIAAYASAYFVAPVIAPFIAPYAKMPEFIMSILAGALIALFVYAGINGLGTMLFRRTGQHTSSVVRVIYGVSGALLGIFFGAFLVWLVVVGVRSLGALAETPASAQNAVSPRAVHAVDVRRGTLNETTDDSSVLTTLARLKNSIEMGAVGNVVKRADVVPTNTYETFGKLGQVVSSSQRAERFLSFPGARELSEHPRIIALREDPEVERLIEQGRYLDLMQNQSVLDALNDPTLVQRVRKFDLQRALDYALEGPPSPR